MLVTVSQTYQCMCEQEKKGGLEFIVEKGNLRDADHLI